MISIGATITRPLVSVAGSCSCFLGTCSFPNLDDATGVTDNLTLYEASPLPLWLFHTTARSSEQNNSDPGPSCDSMELNVHEYLRTMDHDIRSSDHIFRTMFEISHFGLRCHIHYSPLHSLGSAGNCRHQKDPEPVSAET